MRFKKTISVLLLIMVPLLFTIPVIAHDGNMTRPVKISDDHPWQDDNRFTKTPVLEKTITIAIGPIITKITINLPVVKKKNVERKRPQINRTTRLGGGNR